MRGYAHGRRMRTLQSFEIARAGFDSPPPASLGERRGRTRTTMLDHGNAYEMGPHQVNNLRPEREPVSSPASPNPLALPVA